MIVVEIRTLSGGNFIIVTSGCFANTVRRELVLVCLLGVSNVDYSFRWQNNWLPGLRCSDDRLPSRRC